MHPALRQMAEQPELLPAEVRRLLHVRHGEEEGKWKPIEDPSLFMITRHVSAPVHDVNFKFFDKMESS